MGVITRWINGIGAVCLALLCAAPALAAQDVRVAAVYFPPYVLNAEPGEVQPAGLLHELLVALNHVQSDYRFVMVPTAVKRRFADFQQQRFDLAIFENPGWGWQAIPHVALDMQLEDSEVFVARREAGRDQRYFDELHGKRLALYHGYHYAFADFNAEPDYLSKTFNATLTQSHDSNLRMVLRQRADIALVTRSYIGDFLERHPHYAGQLLISERVDQYYRHHALLSPQAPIKPEQFIAAYNTLRDNGQLQKIFSRYQIRVIPGSTGHPIVADEAN